MFRHKCWHVSCPPQGGGLSPLGPAVPVPVIILQRWAEQTKLVSISFFPSSPCPVVTLQSATSSFKEQCGLPTVTKLKQCIQSLATRLQTPESAAGATMVLKEGYPFLEPLVNLAEVTRKLVTAYNTVSRK